MNPWPTTGGATLQPPQPSGFALTSSSGAQAIATTAAGGDSYAQLQAQLRDHGVTYQRLEVWGEGGEWRFFCSIPSPTNASIQRRYEAKAAGDYGLNAIRLVLEQIDRERAAR
jgi:hypothetical protein